MVRIPRHQQPTHPGEMLLRDFLEPLELTQRDLADGIGVPYIARDIERTERILNAA